MRARMRMFAYMTNGNPPPGPCANCGHHCNNQPLVLDVPDVQCLLGLKSRRAVENLIRAGRLRSYKVGRLRKIDRQAVLDYLESVAC
jgi:excisionase family DNA binding protein